MDRLSVCAACLVLACGEEPAVSAVGDTTTGGGADESTFNSLGPPPDLPFREDVGPQAVPCGHADGKVCGEPGDVLSGEELEQLAGCEVSYASVTLSDELWPLSSLRETRGELRVGYGTELETLDGLECLELVDSFWVYGGLLRDLSVLRGMNLSDGKDFPEGNLTIEFAAELGSLDGLQGVTTATEVRIMDNAKLVDLEALSGLHSVRESISIWRNPLLTDLVGLRNIDFEGWIYLGELEGLRNVGGLEQIHTLGGLTITENPVLTSLDGLSGLTLVTGNLEITGNVALPPEEIDEFLAHVVVEGEVVIE